MIYLIGGPPRCGKTTLTKKLAKSLGVSWISADTIESIVEDTYLRFSGSVDSKGYARLFPKNILRIKTKDSNDVLFKRYSPEAVAKVFIKQAAGTGSAIETMVEAETSAGHDYIIEGHQIQPSLVDRLIKAGYEVKAIFLTRKDTAQLSSDFLKSQAKRDWVLQKTKQTKTYPKIAAMISEYSRHTEKQAAKHKLTVFNMDGEFIEKIEEAATLLLSH